MAHDLTIDQLRFTKNQFVASNPTPLSGQLCIETDTNTYKEGNGTTAYASLPTVQLSSDQRRSADDVWASRNEPDGAVTSAPVTPFLYLTAGEAGSTAIYRYQGQNEGKPWYTKVGETATTENPIWSVIWTDGAGLGFGWTVADEGAGALYFSSENVATPDLVQTWTAVDNGGALPLPSIAIYPGPTVQDALEQVAANAANGVKMYIAKVSQSGTDAAVPTVLFNNTGIDPVWSYADLGRQSCLLPNTNFERIVIPTPHQDDIQEAMVGHTIRLIGDDGNGNCQLWLQQCDLTNYGEPAEFDGYAAPVTFIFWYIPG